MTKSLAKNQIEEVKRLLRATALILLIFTSMTGLFYWLNEKGSFNVEDVDIQMSQEHSHPQFYTPMMDELKSELAKYHGQSLWNVDLDKIMTDVKTNKWIKDVHIARRWPAQLILSIEPYPVPLLFVGRNEMIPISNEGKLLKGIENTQAPDVIIATDDDFMKSQELREKAVALIKSLPATGKFSRNSISEIYHDPKQGFWMTLIQDGTRVKFGEGEVQVKAARVNQVLEYLDSRQMQARVIDANLSKKVLVRLRK